MCKFTWIGANNEMYKVGTILFLNDIKQTKVCSIFQGYDFVQDWLATVGSNIVFQQSSLATNIWTEPEL